MSKPHRLSDLQLLGIRLHNFHSSTKDALWRVGSAFFSDKRLYTHEREALKELQSLLTNPNFNRAQVSDVMQQLYELTSKPTPREALNATPAI